jgi:hypothetical protein
LSINLIIPSIFLSILPFKYNYYNYFINVLYFAPLSQRPNSAIADVAVQLCDGDSCLIVLLSDQITVPPSLVNFLRLPNYSFVGFGIKDNVAKLEKNFGFGCRNAIELGPLAASVMKKPRLSYRGVDELLFIVNHLDFRKDRPLRIGFKWDRYGEYSEELAKLATINVYSYHMIGAKLLA